MVFVAACACLLFARMVTALRTVGLHPNVRRRRLAIAESRAFPVPGLPAWAGFRPPNLAGRKPRAIGDEPRATSHGRRATGGEPHAMSGEPRIPDAGSRIPAVCRRLPFWQFPRPSSPGLPAWAGSRPPPPESRFPNGESRILPLPLGHCPQHVGRDGIPAFLSRRRNNMPGFHPGLRCCSQFPTLLFRNKLCTTAYAQECM